MQGIRPAHEGALNAQRERPRESGHQLKGIAAPLLGDQRIGDLPACRLERLHVLRGEIGLDDLPIRCVLGWIHGIRYRQMIRGRIAEADVVFKHALDIFVAKHRPPQIVAMGDRTALAHRVVSGKLIIQNFCRPGIPVGGLSWAHRDSSVIDDQDRSVDSLVLTRADCITSATHSMDAAPPRLICLKPATAWGCHRGRPPDVACRPTLTATSACGLQIMSSARHNICSEINAALYRKRFTERLFRFVGKDPANISRNLVQPNGGSP